MFNQLLNFINLFTTQSPHLDKKIIVQSVQTMFTQDFRSDRLYRLVPGEILQRGHIHRTCLMENVWSCNKANCSFRVGKRSERMKISLANAR